MSPSCFQAPMKRLVNFKSIVKTFNNSLSMSPVPFRYNKPSLQTTSGTIFANKPSKNQVVCENKEEGKSFLNRMCRHMLKYSSWDEILNNKYDHMPAKLMNLAVKPDSMSDDLSNIDGPLSNSCDSKSGSQLTNASDLPNKYKPITISSSRHSGKRGFIEKKAVLTTKRSRNKEHSAVDSHLSKKRRCNSRLSDEEKLEHSKSYLFGIGPELCRR